VCAFVSQAEGSWSWGTGAGPGEREGCCAVQGNGCYSGYCSDHTSSSDYLYRLSPGEPERYETIPGGGTEYQIVDPSYWPVFGGGADLWIGSDGPPGTGGYCSQGTTYRGSDNAACGGFNNWGHTDLEVWFI
jgi:hypothetical protein